MAADPPKGSPTSPQKSPSSTSAGSDPPKSPSSTSAGNAPPKSPSVTSAGNAPPKSPSSTSAGNAPTKSPSSSSTGGSGPPKSPSGGSVGGKGSSSSEPKPNDPAKPDAEKGQTSPSPVGPAPVTDDEKAPMLIKSTEKGSPIKSNEDDDKNAPSDKFNFIFLAICLHGIAMLIPWNLVINSGRYYTDFKLNVTSSSEWENNALAWVRDNFFSLIGTASQTPNLIVTAANIYFPAKGGYKGLTKRIAIAMFVMLTALLINIVLAVAGNKSWAFIWAIFQLSVLIFLYVSTGIYQNCIYGITGRLPMKYSNAVVIGNNVSGTLVSTMAIITYAISPDPTSEAVLYFSIATFIVLVAFIVIFLHKTSNFYRYYMEKSEQKEQSSEKETIPYKTIFYKIFTMAFSVFFCFWVTLFIFPAITGEVRLYDKMLTRSESLFSLIFNFLVFNASAMVGNLVPVYFPQTNIKPGKVWIYVLLRVLLVPFFIYCNYKPNNRALPVYFGDLLFTIGVLVLGFTHGQGSSWCMMYAPSLVEAKYSGTAGMMAAFFLVLGLFVGVHTSYIAPLLVKA